MEEEEFLIRLFKELLDSSNLDLPSEIRDCLETFEDYSWEKKEDAPQKDFDWLLKKGREGSLTPSGLYRFLSMCSIEGDHHICLTILDAKKALSTWRYTQSNTNEGRVG